MEKVLTNFIKNGGNVDTDTSAKVNDSRGYSYKWENIFTYQFDLAKVHSFTVTGVTSWNHNRSDIVEAAGTGILNNSYLWHNLGKANSSTNTSSYSMSKGMGLIGRINYSYLGRYLASVSVRHDGASRLAEGHKWSTFPAFALGWRISDEKFMEGTRSWLSNLKLRLGYGETGSTSGISAYSSVTNLEQGYLTIGGEKVTTWGFSTSCVTKVIGPK